MAIQPTSFITVEEYLSIEERSDIRHEYWNGHMVAMAGGTPTHADIITNLLMAIGGQLRHSGCYVRSADQRVRTASTGLYAYPDLVISCKSEFDRTTLLNPVVLIEVLSESTSDYDRGSKFERYRQIPRSGNTSVWRKTGFTLNTMHVIWRRLKCGSCGSLNGHQTS